MERKRLLAEIDIVGMRGDGVVDSNIMFSGKSFRIYQQIEALKDRNKYRSKRNQIGYTILNNSADTSTPNGTISSRRGGLIEAHTIPRRDPKQAISLVESLDKESYRHVIFWEEGQFLPLDIIPVILEFQKQGRVQWIAGLSADFRGEPFFVMEAIARNFTYYVESKPNCAVDIKGEQCGDNASYNMRVVRELEYPDSQPIKFYRPSEDGGERELITDFVPAPYWHPTYFPKGRKDADYVPVCEDHFRLPASERIKKAISELAKTPLNRRDIMLRVGKENLDDILDFLVRERNVRFDEKTELYCL